MRDIQGNPGKCCCKKSKSYESINVFVDLASHDQSGKGSEKPDVQVNHANIFICQTCFQNFIDDHDVAYPETE